MALLNLFKKRKERERFQQRQKRVDAVVPDALRETATAIEKNRTGVSAAVANVLIRPLVTEKSVALNTQGIYSFKVHARATKPAIARAVEELYLVSVRDVRVINTARKWRFIRGRAGVRPGFRKALVCLNKGQKIEI